MAQILLKFTVKNGRFCLCASTLGTPKRHYRVVENLPYPDYSTWNRDAQKFDSNRPVDAENNKILDNMVTPLLKLLNEREFEDGKALFDYYDQATKRIVNKSKLDPTQPRPRGRRLKTIGYTPTTSDVNEEQNYQSAHLGNGTSAPLHHEALYRSLHPSILPENGSRAMNEELGKRITLREWIEQIIHEIKNPTRLKPSASYQGYLTVLHKLEEEGNIINMPLSEVSDDTFVHLINFINKTKRKRSKNGHVCGNNFTNIMKMFTATLNRARKARLISYIPDFPYMDYAPVYTVTDKAKDFLANGGAIKSLSQKQYEEFESMDLSKINMKGCVNKPYYIELYRDFCMMLYEMRSRPIDVINLHWDNIAYDSTTNKYTCTYIPAKKKNYGASSKRTSKALVIQYLSPKAIGIAMKYLGKSKGGYVFPFSINQRRWNLDRPDDFHRHYYQSNHLCGRINRFLHKVGDYFRLPYNLTLYAFRRTSITKAVADNKMPLAVIAKTSGTSVGMIEANYTNYLHVLSTY